MHSSPSSRPLWIAAVSFVLIALAPIFILLTQQPNMSFAPQLLTDPFLQLPTKDTTRVVWFTEFEGIRHTVAYGQGLHKVALASTTKLTRTREDQKSRVGNQIEEGQVYTKPTMREIWRHEAIVTGLTPGNRVPYRVTSIREDGQSVNSNQFTLASAPQPDTPLKILLTSDHQLKSMTAANVQKVVQTIGQVDAIFFAGDLVDFPDRASEWFDDNRGGAFFPCLQGRANHEVEQDGIKTRYTGGKLIQYAPLFPAIGNHEIMGRFSTETTLNEQFIDAYPRAAAEAIYKKNAQQLNPKNDPKVRAAWLKNNSFNSDTYNEIFTLPDNENYYAVTFGDIRLVSLYITNIWRVPQMDGNARGRFRERDKDLNNPQKWGYGQHIFEPIAKGSTQYNWLKKELNSQEFQQAKYKIVMFHHPPHSLGENIIPPYTDPVQRITQDATGKITAVRYEYPQQADYIIRDVVPLLEEADVQLVLYGHSHVWNRFINPKGIHFLETSNVGNTYGAFLGDKKRGIPDVYQSQYVASGDPNGLEAVMPSLAPLLGDNNQPLPYIASNDITAFSILDTGTGTLSSYRFDTRLPQSEVVKFDEFRLAEPVKARNIPKQVLTLVATVSLILAVVIGAAWLMGSEVKNVTKPPLPL